MKLRISNCRVQGAGCLLVNLKSAFCNLQSHRPSAVTVLVAAVLLALPASADAYIGPGAGFAVLSSFMVVFTTILVAIASVLVWPLRALWRAVHGP